MACAVKYLPSVSSGKRSRYLKRLRVFGLIKRVAKTYRYYPSRIGREAFAMCEKLTKFTIRIFHPKPSTDSDMIAPVVNDGF